MNSGKEFTLRKKILWTFCATGWLYLTCSLIPGSAKESLIETLRQRSDRIHGEIWDLHFCTDKLVGRGARISHAAPTLIVGYDTIYKRPDSSSLSIENTKTGTPEALVRELIPKYELHQGRGEIMEGGSSGPFTPPSNLPGNDFSKCHCSGRVGARGFFPDSLFVEILNDSGVSESRWFTGIKQLRPEKVKPSNRTRITIIFHSEGNYTIQVSERPRLDLYSCPRGGDECYNESLLELLWNSITQ